MVRQSAPSKRCHAVHKWVGRRGQSVARLGFVRTFLDDFLTRDELAGGANDELLLGQASQDLLVRRGLLV